MEENKFIDIDKIIKSKNATLYKIIPRFLINYLKRITHQNEINGVINRNRDYYDYVFARRLIQEFNLKINIAGEENIKNTKRPIIASNHPLGGLDGIALLAYNGYYHGAKAVSNDLLMNIENLKNLFLPINKHGKNAKSYIAVLNESFDSDEAVIFFPAGLVSRKKKGVIKDLEWKKTFVQRAKKHKRDVIPTFIDGHNSHFFYNLANFRKKLGIKANIEMLYLVDEMYKQKNSKITITYGKPIPYFVFDNSKNDQQWAQDIKEHVYELAENPDAVFDPKGA